MAILIKFKDVGRMKKAIVLFFLFTFQYVYTQSDYRKGFIINELNDTIQGYVNYTINSNKFEKVDFKTSLAATSRNYLPTDIKGYGFENNEFFKAHLIKEEKYNKTYFIESLVLGKIELYKLYNEYFIQKDTIFSRLDNDDKIVTVNGTDYSSKNKRYVAVIKYLISDCKKFENYGKDIKYTESDLVKLINEYNICKGGENTLFKENKPWFKANMGVFLGYNIATINNNRKDVIADFKEDSNSASNYVTYGAFIELGSPRIIERISFFTGIMYSSFEYYEYKMSKTGYTLFELNSTNKQINIPIALRYTFPKRKTTPYITFGILNSISISGTSDWSKESKLSSQVYTDLDTFKPVINSVGFISGIGFKRKIGNNINGFIDLNYQYINISNTSNKRLNSYQNNISTIQLLVGIRL